MKSTAVEKQVSPTRGSGLRTDPLTAVLVAIALLLVAAIAALSADLALAPQRESRIAESPVATEPVRSATPSPVPPTPTPLPSPSPAPIFYPAAVRIRIPSIGVDRSIVELALAYDSRSETWQRDYDQLFRSGKKDLVGHYEGSASPGQPGNMILVGHNYGYGVTGVFVRLGRLKVGDGVEVVNAEGQTLAYRVTEVSSMPWRKRSQQELLAHQSYLSTTGPERLTLVTCGGSNWAPFPERVYVVATPAP